MNLPLFISRRLALRSKNSFSGFIVKVAIVAVALSVAVMIVAGSVVDGFQKEISEKVFGFWGHVIIRSYEQNESYGEQPIEMNQSFYPSLDTVQGIKHIQVYATKAGIIKTNEEIEGIVLRGIGPDFDWTFLKEFVVEGNIFQPGDTSARNKIIISSTTASRLKLKVNDAMLIYFVQDPMRFRKLTITGIYKTGLEEYDRLYALVDIGMIQKLNGWNVDEVGGFEVYINDVRKLDEKGMLINENYVSEKLQAKTMKEMNPNLFDWLELQNMNEVVIILLMILVAVINMTTVLLILILERTNMIGILKAVGGTNWLIRKVFLYQAMYITLLGLMVGNVLGIGISLLQKYFHFIKLDEQSYYVSVAPVLLDPVYILFINLGTMVVCLVTLIVPSYLVSRISPVRAIRFD